MILHCIEAIPFPTVSVDTTNPTIYVILHCIEAIPFPTVSVDTTNPTIYVLGTECTLLYTYLSECPPSYPTWALSTYSDTALY